MKSSSHLRQSYRVSVCLTCRRQVNFHEKCCDRFPEPLEVVAASALFTAQDRPVELGERLSEELRYCEEAEGHNAEHWERARKALKEWDDFMADRFVEAVND